MENGQNGHGSVGSDFQNDSSMSETWPSTSQQHYQQGYVVSSSGFAAANNVAATGHDKKTPNRPTGPRRPKVEVAVSI